MRSESINWRPLIPSELAGMRGQAILAIRKDGKGYYGTVIDVTAEYAELANGHQRQHLRFFDSPTNFAIVKGPEVRKPKLADSQLFKKG